MKNVEHLSFRRIIGGSGSEGVVGREEVEAERSGAEGGGGGGEGAVGGRKQTTLPHNRQ